jgi:hypothetical protein
MTIRQLLYRKKRAFQHKLKVSSVRLKWRSHRLPTIALDQIVEKPVTIKPAILDKICLSPYHSPTEHDDFLPVMNIARQLQPKLVVELGTAYGNLTANLCDQLPTTKIFTVNAPVEEQTGEKVTYRLEPDDIGKVYRQHGFSRQVIQIFQNTLTLELGRYLEKRSVGLAIVDACHDADYVVNDFLKVEPFIKSNGVILLHDTHPSMNGHLLGSYWACLRLRKQGYDIKHLVNTWWGIWTNAEHR